MTSFSSTPIQSTPSVLDLFKAKNKHFSLLILAFVFAISKINAQHCREIIGYYPCWQWYDRGQLVNPKTIKYDKYTVINYAFFKPNPDGTIVGTDKWADENLLEGQINWTTSPTSHYPNTSLVDLAHKSGVKVLISIGGWTLSDDFSTIAADEKKRQKFAAECRRLVEFYKIDGIDIDWEYPGNAEHKGTPDDKENFTFLMTNIRQELEDLGQKNGQKYQLTAAFGANSDNMTSIEWSKIYPILDGINLMTYDYNGSWSKQAAHNSPLTSASGGVQISVAELMEKYNVPSEKISVGVAFYGRSVKTSVTPKLASNTILKEDLKTFKQDVGSPLYYNILEKKFLFTEHWDESAKVPYLTGKGNLRTFLSYDNPRSVALKAQFAVEKNLRGVILWEMTGDYIAVKKDNQTTLRTPLVDTINVVLCQNTSDFVSNTSKKTKKEAILTQNTEGVSASISTSQTTENSDAPTQYCSSNGLANTSSFIESVKIGLLENRSGNNDGFGNFTNERTPLSIGSANAISLTASSKNKASNAFWKVWIDFNRDSDFSDSEEQIVTATSTDFVPHTYMFDIPKWASAGYTRMRVQMQQDSFATECSVFANGEVEDYEVQLVHDLRSENGSSANGLVRFDIFPNPNPCLAIQFDLKEKTTVEIQLFDSGNRLKKTMNLGDLEQGFYEKKLEFDDLEDGLYSVKLKAKNERGEYILLEKNWVKL